MGSTRSTGRRRPAVLGALVLVSLAAACRPHSRRGEMVSIPPPEGWEREILRERQAKDELFRTAPDTPLLEEDLAGFDGLEYWPPDPRYYFVGPLNLYARPERFDIVSTAGTLRPCEKVGWVGFELDGRPLRLQVYRLLDGAGGFFLPFMDGTTGEETYPAGRYVELLGPQGGPYVLDLNRAYNPSCAYGAPERFQCPVTPRENRLSVRVEAGERGYRQVAETGAGEG